MKMLQIQKLQSVQFEFDFCLENDFHGTIIFTCQKIPDLLWLPLASHLLILTYKAKKKHSNE